MRHGTATLGAALDVANGAICAACKGRYHHQRFLSVLQAIDESVSRNYQGHAVELSGRCACSGEAPDLAEHLLQEDRSR